MDSDVTIIVTFAVLLWMFLFGAFGAMWAKQKGYAWWQGAATVLVLSGAFFGFLLLVIPDLPAWKAFLYQVGAMIVFGILLRSASPKKSGLGQVKCPFCAEWIKKQAVVCKHCGKEIPKIV